MHFEYIVLEFINEHFKSNFSFKLMYIATKMGDFGIVWIITALMLLIFDTTRNWAVIYISAFIFSCILGNFVLKPFFGRKRPCDDFPVALKLKRPIGYSFPSGHTLTSFAAATIVFFANAAAGIFAFILAGLIGFSRMYFYVHYPSDVVCGAMLGILIGCFFIKIGGLLLW